MWLFPLVGYLREYRLDVFCIYSFLVWLMTPSVRRSGWKNKPVHEHPKVYSKNVLEDYSSVADDPHFDSSM